MSEAVTGARPDEVSVPGGVIGAAAGVACAIGSGAFGFRNPMKNLLVKSWTGLGTAYEATSPLTALTKSVDHRPLRFFLLIFKQLRAE